MKYLVSSLTVASWLALAQVVAAQPQHSQKAESKDEATQPAEPDDDEATPTERKAQDEPSSAECRKSSAALSITVDRKTVSLEQGRLQAKMDGPICKLTLQITCKDGTVIDKLFHYTGPEQELRWDPVPRDQIEKVEIRVTAKNNAYEAVHLIPWSVRIEHEEVKFDSNKAVIRDSEVPSLKESFTKIKEVLEKVESKGLGTVTLFIAGHTDTRGSAEHNMTLSRNRAEAIASWFKKQGLCIPIAFEGFGETALKKLTADEVDEQANRRVDYILAVEPPVIKKGGSPLWKLLSKGCS